jgi:hypothetical protein
MEAKKRTNKVRLNNFIDIEVSGKDNGLRKVCQNRPVGDARPFQKKETVTHHGKPRYGSVALIF